MICTKVYDKMNALELDCQANQKSLIANVKQTEDQF